MVVLVVWCLVVVLVVECLVAVLVVGCRGGAGRWVSSCVAGAVWVLRHHASPGVASLWALVDVAAKAPHGGAHGGSVTLVVVLVDDLL